jgi:hypothetical protein
MHDALVLQPGSAHLQLHAKARHHCIWASTPRSSCADAAAAACERQSSESPRRNQRRNLGDICKSPGSRTFVACIVAVQKARTGYIAI